ncbi:MAG: glycosyltransferase family 4 protein [Patescibacteria group bacterium]
MQNILFYTDTPQTGGAELQMFLLAKFLDEKLYTPILTCSNYSGLDKWCENFEKEGIKVIRLKVFHKHDPRHYFQIRKIIKKEKINFVHLHLWNPGSCRYAFLAINSAKTPIIVTEHDPFELTSLKKKFKKWTLKKISKIVTVSENNKTLLAKLYPEISKKITVIKNGIDTTWWQSQLLRFPDDEKDDIKKDLFKAEKDDFIITSIAELHERKGLKYLIEAMAEVSAKNFVRPAFRGLKLVIIGEGPDRKNLENLIKELKLEEKVILLGKQKNIPKLLKSSDLFVLPSKREAFGLVLLEAMTIPLAIIASRVGGIPEVITDGKNGILVEPESSKELTKAIKSLITNSDKRQALAEAGHKTVTEEFDAEKMAKEYEIIYEKLK